MRRFFGIFVVVGSLALTLGLVAPPAEAAVTLVLKPATASIVEGSALTLSGYAARARSGTVVKLQRWTSSGWATVAYRTLRTTRSYAFTLRPRRGIQRYRVLKPRQLGQARAVSPTSTITVRWRPTVQLQTTYNPYDVKVIGTVPGVPNTFLTEQRRFYPGAAWVTVRRVPTDYTGRFVEDYGDGSYELRYVVPAYGLRLGVVSRSIEITDADARPHYVEPTGTTAVYGDYEGVAIRGTAGQEIYLAVSDPFSVLPGGERVLKPDGSSVPIDFLRGDPGTTNTRGITGHFIAPVTGWYTVYLGRASGEVTASVPKPVPATLDGPPPIPGALVNGQPVDLTFDGAAGDIVTVGDGPPTQCVTETLFEPDGSVTTAFRKAHEGTWQGAWMLSKTGVHRLRVAPCGAQETVREQLGLHRGATVELALDGSAAVTTGSAGQPAVAELSLAKGQRFLPAVGGGWFPPVTVLAPDGTTVEQYPRSGGLVAETTGVYRLVFFLPFSSGEVEFSAGTPRVEASTLDPRRPVTITSSLPREIGVTFTGRAGEVVNGYSSWPFWDPEDETLIGPDGAALWPTYTLERRVWRLPTDGTYTLLHASRAGGGISALTAASGPELVPGETTRMTVQDPSETVIGHFTVTAGQRVTLDDVSDTFESLHTSTGDFKVGVFSPSGYWEGELNVRDPLHAATFTATETGSYAVILQGLANDSTGSVDLSLALQ